jgi:hypothetical protein
MNLCISLFLHVDLMEVMGELLSKLVSGNHPEGLRLDSNRAVTDLEGGFEEGSCNYMTCQGVGCVGRRDVCCVLHI